MQSLTVLFTSSQQYDQTFVAGESKIIFASGDLYLYKKKHFFLSLNIFFLRLCPAIFTVWLRRHGQYLKKKLRKKNKFFLNMVGKLFRVSVVVDSVESDVRVVVD